MDCSTYDQYFASLKALREATLAATPVAPQKPSAAGEEKGPKASFPAAAPPAKEQPKRRSIIVRKDGKGDCRTVEEALAMARNGDAIWIADGGVYAESILPAQSRSNILLSGNPEKPTIITADPQKLPSENIPPFLTVGPNWTIQFIQFRWDIKGRGAGALSTSYWDGSLVIQNCGFTGFGDNIGPVAGNKDILIRNCAFYKLGITLHLSDFGEKTTVRFLHNTLVQCSFGIQHHGSKKFTLVSQGNIFCKVSKAYEDHGADAPSGTQVEDLTWVSDRNCFDSPCIYTRTRLPRLEARTLRDWFALTKNDKNSLMKDPLLVNPEKGDFHLRPTSPCIGHMVEEDGKRTSIGIDFRAMRLEAEEQSDLLKAALRDRKKP
jgi:hypothetical protein